MNTPGEQISNLEELAPRPSVSRFIKQLLGYLIAIACLVWVFHDIHPERIFQQVAEINWGWVGLAVLFDVASYFSQGSRWELLLRPIGRISPLRATQAIYVGLFTNEILPLRAGELVRAFLASRWLSTPLMSVIPAMAVERFFDAIWLALGIGLTVIFVELPKNLINAADILGIFVISATGLFAYLVFRKEKQNSAKSGKSSSAGKISRSVKALIDRLASGIRNIGTSRHFYLALLVSSLVIIGQIISFWMMMWAYGLKFSIWIGAAVFMIVHLGTALPNAPSNVGTYQFFCVVGLTLFGVDKTTATGYSMAAFVLLTLPLWAIGLVAVSTSGMKLKEIRNEIIQAMRRKRKDDEVSKV